MQTLGDIMAEAERQTDEQKQILARIERQAIDVTNLATKRYREKVVSLGDFANGMEAFNRLSPIPGPLDLGDGRKLFIRTWTPSTNMDTPVGMVNVQVEGFIRLTLEAIEAMAQK